MSSGSYTVLPLGTRPSPLLSAARDIAGMRVKRNVFFSLVIVYILSLATYNVVTQYTESVTGCLAVATCSLANERAATLSSWT